MKRIILDENDVVSMKLEQSIANTSTSKVAELKSAAGGCFKTHSGWFTHSVPCEVLTEKSGWVKGKVRFVLEFVPAHEQMGKLTPNAESTNEESSLDDLRERLDL